MASSGVLGTLRMQLHSRVRKLWGRFKSGRPCVTRWGMVVFCKLIHCNCTFKLMGQCRWHLAAQPCRGSIKRLMSTAVTAFSTAFMLGFSSLFHCFCPLSSNDLTFRKYHDPGAAYFLHPACDYERQISAARCLMFSLPAAPMRSSRQRIIPPL